MDANEQKVVVNLEEILSEEENYDSPQSPQSVSPPLNKETPQIFHNLSELPDEHTSSPFAQILPNELIPSHSASKQEELLRIRKHWGGRESNNPFLGGVEGQVEREGQRYSASELELNKMKSFPCQLQGGLNLRERQASFGYTSGSYTSTSSEEPEDVMNRLSLDDIRCHQPLPDNLHTQLYLEKRNTMPNMPQHRQGEYRRMEAAGMENYNQQIPFTNPFTATNVPCMPLGSGGNPGVFSYGGGQYPPLIYPMHPMPTQPNRNFTPQSQYLPQYRAPMISPNPQFSPDNPKAHYLLSDAPPPGIRGVALAHAMHRQNPHQISTPPIRPQRYTHGSTQNQQHRIPNQAIFQYSGGMMGQQRPIMNPMKNHTQSPNPFTGLSPPFPDGDRQGNVAYLRHSEGGDPRMPPLIRTTPESSPNEDSTPTTSPTLRAKYYDRSEGNRGMQNPNPNPNPNLSPTTATKEEKRRSVIAPPLLLSKKTEISEIKGSILKYATDQHGSRFIQQKFELSTDEDRNIIFDEILPQAYQLMTDLFGNYVLQKILEYGNTEQKSLIANHLFGSVLCLSKNMYGCRVVQKALEVISDTEQKAIIDELNGCVMECVDDQNANHVIQKCIETIPHPNINFIIQHFQLDPYVMCVHAYGCRVIQRILESSPIDIVPTKQTQLSQKEEIMKHILSRIDELAKDQYGNYVIQHILEHGLPDQKSIIIQKIIDNLATMASHKFASNVIEKCFIHGSEDERNDLLNQIMGITEHFPNTLFGIMSDRFGNYVIQKALEISSEEQRKNLISRVKLIQTSTRKQNHYCKHVYGYIEKHYTGRGKYMQNVQSVRQQDQIVLHKLHIFYLLDSSGVLQIVIFTTIMLAISLYNYYVRVLYLLSRLYIQQMHIPCVLQIAQSRMSAEKQITEQANRSPQEANEDNLLFGTDQEGSLLAWEEGNGRISKGDVLTGEWFNSDDEEDEYSRTSPISPVPIPTRHDNFTKSEYGGSEVHRTDRPIRRIAANIDHYQEALPLIDDSDFQFSSNIKIDIPLIKKLFISPSGGFDLTSPYNTIFSKEHHRDKLLNAIKPTQMRTKEWVLAAEKANPYSLIDEEFFHKYSGIITGNLNSLVEFEEPYNIGPTTFCLCLGDDGGFSEHLLWTFSTKHEAKCCVWILQESENGSPVDESKLRNECLEGNKIFNLERELELLNNNNSLLSEEFVNRVESLIEERTSGQKIFIMYACKELEMKEIVSQELGYKKYMVIYTLIALKCLCRGAHLVLKLYDMFTPFTNELIYILYKNFEQITIVKPFSSIQYTADRYLICTAFKSNVIQLEGLTANLLDLHKLLGECEQKGLDVSRFMEPCVLNGDQKFKTYILEANSIIAEMQIEAYKHITQFYNRPNLELEKEEIKFKCLPLWGIPVKEEQRAPTSLERGRVGMEHTEEVISFDYGETVNKLISRTPHVPNKPNSTKLVVRRTPNKSTILDREARKYMDVTREGSSLLPQKRVGEMRRERESGGTKRKKLSGRDKLFDIMKGAPIPTPSNIVNINIKDLKRKNAKKHKTNPRKEDVEEENMRQCLWELIPGQTKTCLSAGHPPSNAQGMISLAKSYPGHQKEDVQHRGRSQFAQGSIPIGIASAYFFQYIYISNSSLI